MKNLRITVNGTAYDVQVEELSGSEAPAVAAAPAAAASTLFLFNYADYGCGNYCHNHSQNYKSSHI